MLLKSLPILRIKSVANPFCRFCYFSSMKKSLLNTSAFRYIFEIIVIVFSVTLSFYIQDVLNDREKIELKNIGLKAVLTDLDKDKEFYSGELIE